ncbi:MAG: hypothetical protein K2N94_12885 [Lachnospiraceae bacterium]|nr:hypothetical protein [Lachnospiraceae bacterium]
MGLFKNNKKLCPVCGSPTPRLFATSVEKMPLCKECARKVDLPEGVLDTMSLEDFKQYLSFYDGNQRLREMFSETNRYTFSLLSGSLLVDAAHGLFRLREDDNALVLEADNLKSFRILEDTKPLYESGERALKCYPSDVPGRVGEMAAKLSNIALKRLILDQIRDKEDMQASYRDNVDTDQLTPFRHFYVELSFDHPYWKEFKSKRSAPTFDPNNPSADVYMEAYQQEVDKLHALAKSLMQMICADAQETMG